MIKVRVKVTGLLHHFLRLEAEPLELGKAAAYHSKLIVQILLSQMIDTQNIMQHGTTIHHSSNKTTI